MPGYISNEAVRLLRAGVAIWLSGHGGPRGPPYLLSREVSDPDTGSEVPHSLRKAPALACSENRATSLQAPACRHPGSRRWRGPGYETPACGWRSGLSEDARWMPFGVLEQALRESLSPPRRAATPGWAVRARRDAGFRSIRGGWSAGTGRLRPGAGAGGR